MSLIWEEMIAAGTILLAIATFVAVFREPVSNRLKAPKVIVEPSNATYSHDNPSNYFVTKKAKGGAPLHIWVRINIKNIGKLMAEDVYVRLVSVERYIPKNWKCIVSVKPFNPFRLKWVSESANYGNLINNEPAYLNLCTLVGQYKGIQASNSKYVMPVIVPGLPNTVEGDILGEGQVAGMEPSIYKSGIYAGYRYELIVGGSNINSKRYYVYLIYSLNRGIKEELGKPDRFQNLHEFVKLRFQISEV